MTAAADPKTFSRRKLPGAEWGLDEAPGGVGQNKAREHEQQAQLKRQPLVQIEMGEAKQRPMDQIKRIGDQPDPANRFQRRAVSLQGWERCQQR